HAGVERRQQVLLRIGEPVRSAQLVWLVYVDRESARDLFSADFEARYLRAAARLTLPGRGDAPVRLAVCRVFLDALDEGEQVVDIDAVYDGGLNGLGLSSHGGCPLLE